MPELEDLVPNDNVRKYNLLRDLLASPAWNLLMVPHLQSFKENDIVRLSMMRKDDDSTSDDYLRGRLAVFDFLLRGLTAQVEEWEKTLFPPVPDPEDDGQPTSYGDPYAAGPTPEGM